MVNQDPQPDVFTSEHTISANTAANTANTNTVWTNQGQGEEVRIYAIGIEVLDSMGRDVTHYQPIDYDLTIMVGSNKVPSNPFDMSVIALKEDKTLTLSVPVVVGFKQQLRVTVTNKVATNSQANGGTAVTVNVHLYSETGILKVAC